MSTSKVFSKLGLTYMIHVIINMIKESQSADFFNA